MNLPVIAGIVSTCFFLLGEWPMLSKAFRTKDLASYSPGNILMANMGNAVHSIYVFHLPFGPIWLLHSFYLVSTALMLVWYLLYEQRPYVTWWSIGLRDIVQRWPGVATCRQTYRLIVHGAARSGSREDTAASRQLPHGTTPSGE